MQVVGKCVGREILGDTCSAQCGATRPPRRLYLMLSVWRTWPPSASASFAFSSVMPWRILRSSRIGSPLCHTIPTRPDPLLPMLVVPLTPYGGTCRGTTCCWIAALKLARADQLISSLNSSILASCDLHHGAWRVMPLKSRAHVLQVMAEF